MPKNFRPIEWLRYAGLITWLLSVIPLAFLPALGTSQASTNEIAVCWMAALVFILVYWYLVSRLPVLGPLYLRLPLVGVLTVASLTVSLLTQSTIGAILFFIVAGLMPWLLPVWLGLGWVVVSAALFGAMSMLQGAGPAVGLLSTGIYLGLTVFAFMASNVAKQLHLAQSDLRRVNSELRATQALLTENTRIAERVRIARELHDLVGHHLTALTLNLEVASHLTTERARQHVEQARSIAKLLLSDVREVVSDMRMDDRVDLAAVIRALADGVPEPRIHLNMPLSLPLTDPQRAQILLRSVQEVITNTVRHARAKNLWITLRGTGDGLEFIARDDGQGVAGLTAGNGLTGMRERWEGLHGRLKVESTPGRGFRVEAWMPSEIRV